MTGLLPTASASARVVLGRCVRSCHMWLGASSFHASSAAITFHALCPAVSTHARRVRIAIIRSCTLDTAIAADHSVIAVMPPVRTAVSPGSAVSVRLCSGRMLNAAVAAN
jgi:hypothetical protein